MKKSKIGFILLVVFILVACGRSKNPEFYILNPISPQKKPINAYHNLRIGIDKVSVPAYAEKPQLAINYTAHRMGLDEDKQWIEGLDKNTTRVIVTNLASLLPGAIVNSSPWDSIFKPNYHLAINIIQFNIDVSGNSVLRADYTLYQNDHLLGKHDFYHAQKIPIASTENIVVSMNNNLTIFTQDIAKYFKLNHKKLLLEG